MILKNKKGCSDTNAVWKWDFQSKLKHSIYNHAITWQKNVVLKHLAFFKKVHSRKRTVLKKYKYSQSGVYLSL
jgi:hypothetical protein